ncbi:MAG: hypothetical protein KME16_03820 [Scytolyngbya sp. HA4215-MV1]|jgi:hypothetical protein|nr:hypothetical protein [Scytolyngbya sp. HA4215-MV1]
MKRLILAGLSVLLATTTIVPAVKAESRVQWLAMSNTSLNQPLSSHLTPFDLVTLARQGYLQPQGIPSYDGLFAAYRTGRISAQDLVQGAIASRRLDAKFVANQVYLNAIETQLQALDNDH